MAQISFPADSSTLVLNGHVFNDFVAGDIVSLAPVNPHTAQVIGSGGGVSIFERVDGDVYNLTVRLMRGSNDDAFMNSSVNAGLVVFEGSLKSNYTIGGNDRVESWNLQNGSITTKPTGTINDQDGNALSEYVVMFRSCRRAM